MKGAPRAALPGCATIASVTKHALIAVASIVVRNTSAAATTMRLIALFRMTASSGRNRKTPSSTGSRNSAPPKPTRPPSAPMLAPQPRAATKRRVYIVPPSRDSAAMQPLAVFRRYHDPCPAPPCTEVSSWNFRLSIDPVDQPLVSMLPRAPTEHNCNLHCPQSGSP